MEESSKPTFVLLQGPTASGKTDLGFLLQETLGGPLLNADAIQCYEEVEVGAAKPPLEQRRQPHVHLFDWVSYPQELTARLYAEKAWDVVDQNLGEEFFFFVGGSGFYIRALEKGLLAVPPSEPEKIQALQKELQLQGQEALYKELQSLDPERAQVIAPQDHYRLLRSLEVVRATGRTFSDLQKDRDLHRAGLRARGKVVPIGLEAPKDWLLQRVSQRVDQMLKEGFIEEVRSLLGRGRGGWAPLKSVGYKEVALHLQGKLDFKSLKEEIVQRTMGLAKRQRTWSHSLKNITMVDARLGPEALLKAVAQALKESRIQ